MTKRIPSGNQQRLKATWSCIKCVPLERAVRLFIRAAAIWLSRSSFLSLNVSSEDRSLIMSSRRCTASQRQVPHSEVTLLNSTTEQSYFVSSSDMSAVPRTPSLQGNPHATGAEMRLTATAATFIVENETVASARQSATCDLATFVIQKTCSSSSSASFKFARF